MINLSTAFSVSAGLSYDQAEQLLTSRELRYYRFAWKWCAPRLSNVENAGQAQELVYIRWGYSGLMKRINRVRKWFGMPEYPRNND